MPNGNSGTIDPYYVAKDGKKYTDRIMKLVRKWRAGEIPTEALKIAIKNVIYEIKLDDRECPSMERILKAEASLKD
jgi:hypothetical protein